MSEINERDLRIDVYTNTGGVLGSKTVDILHVPTGIRCAGFSRVGSYFEAKAAALAALSEALAETHAAGHEPRPGVD